MMLGKNTKKNNVGFNIVPLQNHNHWISMETNMEPQRRLETNFITIENNDKKTMVFIQLSDTFLHVKLPRGGT